MPFTDSAKTTMLNAFKGTNPTLVATHISAHTAYPGTTLASEVSGGSYARQSISFGTPSAGVMAASNTPTIPIPASTTVSWVSLASASTSGTSMEYAPLGGVPKFYTVDTGTDVFTSAAHGYSDTNTVVFYGNTVPGGLTAGTTYFIRDSATDTFKVAATSGGTAINITSAGSAGTRISIIVPEEFTNAGNLIIDTFSLNLNTY